MAAPEPDEPQFTGKRCRSNAKVRVSARAATQHRTPAQIQRDHDRDLELRAAGYIVLRYTEAQLLQNREAILTELQRYL